MLFSKIDFSLKHTIQCICQNPDCKMELYTDSENKILTVLPIYADISYPTDFHFYQIAVNLYSDKKISENKYQYLLTVLSFIDSITNIVITPIRIIYNFCYFLFRDFTAIPDIIITDKDAEIIKSYLPDIIISKNFESATDQNVLSVEYIIDKAEFSFEQKLSYIIKGYIITELYTLIPANNSERQYYIGQTLSR